MGAKECGDFPDGQIGVGIGVSKLAMALSA